MAYIQLCATGSKLYHTEEQGFGCGINWTMYSVALHHRYVLCSIYIVQSLTCTILPFVVLCVLLCHLNCSKECYMVAAVSCPVSTWASKYVTGLGGNDGLSSFVSQRCHKASQYPSLLPWGGDWSSILFHKCYRWRAGSVQRNDCEVLHLFQGQKEIWSLTELGSIGETSSKGNQQNKTFCNSARSRGYWRRKWYETNSWPGSEMAHYHNDYS